MTLVDPPRSCAPFTTLLVAIGVLMISPGGGRAADEPIVQTVSGAVSGSEGDVRSFKGIPLMV